MSRVPGEHLDVAGHIGERDDDQSIAGPRVVVQAGVRVRSEDRPQFGCARDELVVVRRQKGACRVLVDAAVPVGAQFDQQPGAVHRDARVGRGGVDADQFAAA